MTSLPFASQDTRIRVGRFIIVKYEDGSMASKASREPADDDLATAIGQYVLGEISLGKAAENAGMTRWEFEELLQETGFTALYGPRTAEDLQDEVDVALDLE